MLTIYSGVVIDSVSQKNLKLFSHNRQTDLPPVIMREITVIPFCLKHLHYTKYIQYLKNKHQ